MRDKTKVLGDFGIFPLLSYIYLEFYEQCMHEKLINDVFKVYEGRYEVLGKTLGSKMALFSYSRVQYSRVFGKNHIMQNNV